jgi:hypothetical protein
MALKHCWQKKRLQGKEYADQYRERIDTIKKVQKPGLKKKLNRIGTAANYRFSVSRNWLLLIPCIFREIMCHLPVWIFELFRFCPKAGRSVTVDDSFLIVGHRGAPAYEVESTIPSCQRALDKDGANALEVDVSMTRDQQI